MNNTAVRQSRNWAVILCVCMGLVILAVFAVNMWAWFNDPRADVALYTNSIAAGILFFVYVFFIPLFYYFSGQKLKKGEIPAPPSNMKLVAKYFHHIFPMEPIDWKKLETCENRKN